MRGGGEALHDGATVRLDEPFHVRGRAAAVLVERLDECLDAIEDTATARGHGGWLFG